MPSVISRRDGLTIDPMADPLLVSQVRPAAVDPPFLNVPSGCKREKSTESFEYITSYVR
jgi:hypothetical protein